MITLECFDYVCPWTKPFDTVDEAVAYSRSEEGQSTCYMAAKCPTRELAAAFAIACYMAGMPAPPDIKPQEDGTSLVILWDELNK